MSDLNVRPCPMCGSSSIELHTEDVGGGNREILSYYMECDDCGLRTCGESTEEKGVAGWNERPADPALALNFKDLDLPHTSAKTCPFCKETKARIRVYYDSGKSARMVVYCSMCGASGPVSPCGDTGDIQSIVASVLNALIKWGGGVNDSN